MTESNSRRVPKQARSQERYEVILDRAAKLFLEKGFSATTTNEIARQADVSIGSLYQYFGNKSAIVEALTERYVEALKEVTSDLVTMDTGGLATSAAVDRLVDPIIMFHLNYPEFRSLWLGAEISPELRSAMRAMDEEVLAHVQEVLEVRVPGISQDRARMVVTVLGLSVKSLLGLIGRSSSAAFKAEAAIETKHMLTAYIDELAREQKRLAARE